MTTWTKQKIMQWSCSNDTIKITMSALKPEKIENGVNQNPNQDRQSA